MRRLEQGGEVWRTLSTQVEMLHILETTVKYLFQSIPLFPGIKKTLETPPTNVESTAQMGLH